MRKYLFGSAAAFALIVAAACSGGTSNAPNVPFPAASGVGAGTLSSTSAAVISIPASTGLGTGSVGLLGSGSVAATQSATNPSSTKVVQTKTLKGASAGAQGAGNTPLAYITLTASGSSTISSITSLSVAPTGTVPGGSYYLAFWNGTQWVTIGSAGKFASGVITFSAASLTPEVTLASGQSYNLAVYTGSIFTTPTPPPPAPVASPTLTASLGTLATITVTSGIGITITASTDNASVAKPDTATASTGAGTTATFQIDPVAVGTAHLTFTDPLGRSTVVQVTVNNTYPSPNPNLASGAVISLGSTPTIGVITKIGHVIRAVSSDTTVLTVPSQATAGSDSLANFAVTTVGPGQATITFTDEVNDQSSFTATVSNIKNGGFNNGMANWSDCSYSHTPLAAPINEGTPIPVNPVATQSPGAASTPVPAASLAGLSMVATPPPNDNPSPPPGVGATAPPELGTTVALLGSLDESVHNQPRGEYGVCQTVTVSAKTPKLWFWIWEGGSNFNFKSADTNVDVLDQSGNLQATLLAEQHCYIHPGSIGSPGQAANAFTSLATSGCWPYVYGGDRSTSASAPFKDWVGGGFWSLRGPFDLSGYVGTPITLYFGNYSNSASTSANFSSFMFLGNVEMLPATMTTPPPVAPLASRHSVTLELRHR